VRHDGSGGAPADFGIRTSEVVDERLQRTVVVRGDDRICRFGSVGSVVRWEGIEFDPPGRRFVIPVVKPEQPHEFFIGERFGLRGRRIVQKTFGTLSRPVIQVFARINVLVVPERGIRGHLHPVRGSGIVETQAISGDLFMTVLFARRGEGIELPECFRDPLHPPDDILPVVVTDVLVQGRLRRFIGAGGF